MSSALQPGAGWHRLLTRFRRHPERSEEPLYLASHRRIVPAFVACLLAVLMLGANASGDSGTQRYGRIGHNLMCVCGCGQILLECNHVGCPDSARMIGELRDELDGPNGGGADSLVLNWFTAKYGGMVLAAPIRGGFDNVAWIIPIALFLFATVGTAWLVRAWARRPRMASPAGMPSFEPSDDLRERIRRDTEYR